MLRMPNIFSQRACYHHELGAAAPDKQMLCLKQKSKASEGCAHVKEGTHFMAAATLALEVRALMLAEMVLISRAGPLFRVRLLTDLHLYV